MNKYELVVDGKNISLDETEMMKIHHFYKKERLKEYILENYNNTDEQSAGFLAEMTLEIMQKEEPAEDLAIFDAIYQYKDKLIKETFGDECIIRIDSERMCNDFSTYFRVPRWRVDEVEELIYSDSYTWSGCNEESAKEIAKKLNIEYLATIYEEDNKNCDYEPYEEQEKRMDELIKNRVPSLFPNTETM